MSQLKRNVIAVSLAAAGMFAVAAPSMAAPTKSEAQVIKVKTTVGSNMEWERVDGVSWTEAMELTFKPVTGGVELKEFTIDTLVKPAKAGGEVSFMIKDELKLVDLANPQNEISGFTISLGGEVLNSANATVIVPEKTSGVLGVAKTLKVTKSDKVTGSGKANYKGYTSIVMEGKA